MLVSPCFTLLVGCMIKRLLVVELAAVLFWVHMKRKRSKKLTSPVYEEFVVGEYQL